MAVVDRLADAAGLIATMRPARLVAAATQRNSIGKIVRRELQARVNNG